MSRNHPNGAVKKTVQIVGGVIASTLIGAGFFNWASAENWSPFYLMGSGVVLVAVIVIFSRWVD